MLTSFDSMLFCVTKTGVFTCKVDPRFSEIHGNDPRPSDICHDHEVPGMYTITSTWNSTHMDSCIYVLQFPFTLAIYHKLFLINCLPFLSFEYWFGELSALQEFLHPAHNIICICYRM